MISDFFTSSFGKLVSFAIDIGSSKTVKTLFAPAAPEYKTIFIVAKDLIGWYASIIAVKKEKKLFISNSPLAIKVPEKKIKPAIIIPVRISIIGVALISIL